MNLDVIKQGFKNKTHMYLLIVGVVFLTLVYTHRKHQRELLEVSRISQYVGCMQTVGVEAMCSRIVFLTPQQKIIDKVLDSKEDEGKLIIEGQTESEEEPNGNFN